MPAASELMMPSRLLIMPGVEQKKRKKKKKEKEKMFIQIKGI